jgi:hypothetical protein
LITRITMPTEETKSHNVRMDESVYQDIVRIQGELMTEYGKQFSLNETVYEMAIAYKKYKESPKQEIEPESRKGKAKTLDSKKK